MHVAFISREFVWLQNHCIKKASDPLASAIDFPLSDAILHSKKTNNNKQTCVVFTSGFRVDLIPAMYLVLFNPSRRLRDKQAKGSISSNVLTTFMNFSLAAQGDGLPSGWVEKMRRPFDAADHTHTTPPVG